MFSKNRILSQDVDRLIEPFRNRNEDHCWQGEFWGKWFTSAVLAYRYRPEPALKAVLDRAVSDLISTQSPDGYIGNYAKANRLEQWDIWGRKYCMLGLLAYYDITLDVKSLDAAGKLADHLIKELAENKALIVEKGNFKGMPASSILEPITQLYVRTNDKKYLSFAEEIIQQWESPVCPQLISKSATAVGSRFPFPAVEQWATQWQKAYEMMSCYESLLELYDYRKASLQNSSRTNMAKYSGYRNQYCGFRVASECCIIKINSNKTSITGTCVTITDELAAIAEINEIPNIRI